MKIRVKSLFLSFVLFFNCIGAALHAQEGSQDLQPHKKMLVLFTTMDIGGAAKALVDMLVKMPSIGISTEEVDVCITEKQNGDFTYLFPKGVRFISKRDIGVASYDVAVSYSECIDPQMLVQKIKAKKRIQWIHIDLVPSGWRVGLLNRSRCDGIDCFVCVSDQVKEGFCKLHPDLRSKTVLIYNIIDGESIRKKAEEPICEISDNELSVVSVGRLASQKGLDRAIRVQRRLLDEGFSFHWYVVGEGPERKNLERMVDQYNLRGKFILLGKRVNPYPFVKKADICAVPSRYEGYGLVVTEGKILQKPVIVTDFAGAREQIVSEETGLVVANDEEAIYQGMKRMLQDQSLREKISKNLEHFDFDNKDSLDKLKTIFFVEG